MDVEVAGLDWEGRRSDSASSSLIEWFRSSTVARAIRALNDWERRGLLLGDQSLMGILGRVSSTEAREGVVGAVAERQARGRRSRDDRALRRGENLGGDLGIALASGGGKVSRRESSARLGNSSVKKAVPALSAGLAREANGDAD